MYLIPLLLIGTITAIGVGYFCLDLYRNRHRLSQKPYPVLDPSTSESWPGPECGEVPVVESSTSHGVGHGVGEASHCVSHSVGHCIDAVGHTVSHH